MYLSGGQEEIQRVKSTGSIPKYPVNSPGGLELYGIHHLILNSIMAADEDLHQESDVFLAEMGVAVECKKGYVDVREGEME